MSNLRRATARACPIHQQVLDAVINEINANGRFLMSDIINKLRFKGIEDSIRWDYIVDFISEDYNIDLLPMASSFWKRHKREERQINPGRFLATGNGKRTAGYAVLDMDGGIFAKKKLSDKASIVKGSAKSVVNLETKINKKIKLDNPDMADIKAIANG